MTKKLIFTIILVLGICILLVNERAEYPVMDSKNPVMEEDSQLIQPKGMIGIPDNVPADKIGTLHL